MGGGGRGGGGWKGPGDSARPAPGLQDVPEAHRHLQRAQEREAKPNAHVGIHDHRPGSQVTFCDEER